MQHIYRVHEDYSSEILSVSLAWLIFVVKRCEFREFRIWRMAAKMEGVLVQIGMDPVHYGGWEYSVIGDYILDFVYPLEMEQTGIAKKLISGFRNACEDAPVVPNHGEVVVERNAPGAEDWHKAYVDHFAQKLELPASEKITCRFGDVVAADATSDLQQLDKSQLTWDIPEVDSPSQRAQPTQGALL